MIRAKIIIQCDLLSKKRMEALVSEVKDKVMEYSLAESTTNVSSQTVPLDVDEMFNVMEAMDMEDVKTILGMDDEWPEICSFCGSVMQDGKCLAYDIDPEGHKLFSKRHG